MVEQVMDFIEGYDKEIGEAIKAECGRQRRNLELIASENIVSEPVMAAMGTVLTKDIQENAITADVSLWTWWRPLPLNGQRSCLDATM